MLTREDTGKQNRNRIGPCVQIFFELKEDKNCFRFISKKKNRRFGEHNFVVVYEASSLGGAVLK